MPRIIAYTYEAAMHCPDCTRAALRHPFRPRLSTPYPGPREVDSHGLPEDMRDREGNPVRPVFSTDDRNGTDHCDTCRARFDA